jgi:phosphoglucosamine mutase
LRHHLISKRKLTLAEKKLFGTDGIRGTAGEPPLDPRTIFAAGVSLGNHLRDKSPHPRVLIGEDTRESCRWIAETVAAGLTEAGAEIRSTGVITTPGVARLTASGGFDAGVMISASHNPYRDNGIKVFASTGYKLPDEDEERVERGIFRLLADSPAPQAKRVALRPDRQLVATYIAYLRSEASAFSLPGTSLVLDCANGSASALAAEVFSGFGLNVKIISGEPDGKNINVRCGSTDLTNLRQTVMGEKADLGIAFDGDADRALFVSSRGVEVNGDGVLLAAARYMMRRGTLRGGAVVGTVMSNLGLERILEREGLRLLRAPVGDKYVLAEMLRSGCNLGGEQSGHVIFLDLSTTGDGLLTALQVLRIMAEERRPIEELVEGLVEFPQILVNVRVKEKVPFENVPQIVEEIRASERRLGNTGRVLVRYSGTEPLARVMVEAENAADVERNAQAIASAIESSLGAGRIARSESQILNKSK